MKVTDLSTDRGEPHGNCLKQKKQISFQYLPSFCFLAPPSPALRTRNTQTTLCSHISLFWSFPPVDGLSHVTHAGRHGVSHRATRPGAAQPRSVPRPCPPDPHREHRGAAGRDSGPRTALCDRHILYGDTVPASPVEMPSIPSQFH